MKGKGVVSIDGKKRGRDSEDGGNLNGSDLISDVEKLREMKVQELRDEAVRRGIASTGSKKELLKRICEDCENEKEEDETEGISNYILIGAILPFFRRESLTFDSLLMSIGVSKLVSEPKHAIPPAKLVVIS